MKCPKLILLIVASFFLCSCAVVDSTKAVVDSTKRLISGPEDTGPKIYYVGLSDLKLFSEPHSSKTYVAKLPLNEKVMRYKMQKGFAHVKVVSTGQTGWVKSAHLIWKKGEPPAKKPPEKELIEKDWKPDPEKEGRNASMFDAF
ncbi:MAG: hypothetical protein MUO68_01130 [Desulfobacteraceae bacterium]|jgi:hypothetical protein|nr:hypothetical protein [Desulfobacteraceae bacterium]